jgi:uracil-DNA glycosylase
MNDKNKDIAKQIYSCRKCDLDVKINPEAGIIPIYGENDPSKPIWIVGLNPKLNKDGTHHPVEATETFQAYIDHQLTYFGGDKELHPYYRRFQHIFGSNWREIIRDNVFHTDIVKCPSVTFGKKETKAIPICKEFLQKQITLNTPKIIFCNGRNIVNWFEDKYEGEIQLNYWRTGGELKINGQIVHLIYSGFINRIDNIAKRRIGKEVCVLIKKELPALSKLINSGTEGDEEEEIDIEKEIEPEIEIISPSHHLMEKIEPKIKQLVAESNSELFVKKGKGMYRLITTEKWA